MESQYKQFYKLLDNVLRGTKDKNVIIYGCNRGGDFVRWFYKKYYGKTVKAVIDRWVVSPTTTVPHLMSLYYMYDSNDVIVNVTPKDIVREFNDIGEDWNAVRYEESQIIDLWRHIYPDWNGEEEEPYPQIDYFDYMEQMSCGGVRLLETVRRKFVKGAGAHGYYPTDFRIFVDALEGERVRAEDAVLDIGAGKGGGVLAFSAVGFHRIGAVEYTEEIYKTMESNLQALSMPHDSVAADAVTAGWDEKVKCYLGDAALITEELDKYTWFFLFNPFSLDVTERVIQNICDSLDRIPRKIRILYAEPMGHQIIVDTGKFHRKKRICEDYAEATYWSYLYESE